MKIGLYSITYAGIWYDGPALSVKELIGRAKAQGYSGVELDGKRPHGNPMDLDEQARDAIRSEAARLGIEIVGVASNNDFSSPVPEHRQCQLLMVREQIRLCADLGGKVVRLFGAWPGVTFREGLATYDLARPAWERAFPGSTRLERWRFVRDCLTESAAFAQAEGIVVALQNHGPLIRHWRDVLDLVREVDSPALKVCLDAPMLIRQDTDFVREAVHAVGALQAHCHFGGEFRRLPDGRIAQKPPSLGRAPINYRAYLQALVEIGYQGYLCYEFCHPALDERHERLGLAAIDEQARLARSFMHEQIAAVSG
jgi:sugar phosphate isomerase/epimerase